MSVRVIIVGGFLGAGKTTLLLQAAQLLAKRGLRVGLVTNDQGRELVDTSLASRQKLPVVEVAGGCFCCRFPDLIGGLRHLQRTVAPDVILAEPVGSCTDLIATVVRPLMALHHSGFELAPLTVVSDGARSTSGHAHSIEYLYSHQIAEAEIIALSKCDLLTPEQAEAAAQRIERLYSPVSVYRLSAHTGDGVADWLDAVMSNTSRATCNLQIDYDHYAMAEAALSWLNAQGDVQAITAFSPANWVAQTLRMLDEALSHRGAEIAHVKLQAIAGDDYLKASLVTSAAPPSWDTSTASAFCQQLRFILNARVHTEPLILEQTVRRIFAEVTPAPDLQYRFEHFECFSPSPPQPTYRMTAASDAGWQS